MNVNSRPPLHGIRVIEFAGIGPGPHAAMLLSDMGAEVVRIDRKGKRNALPIDVTSRGRTAIDLDLKDPKDHQTAMSAIARADVVIEGFRPGVMERLNLGPDSLCAQFPRLIFGRMTGWGQNGPLAQKAGHDINYIAMSGVLAAIGDGKSPPSPPLNLVGDFGGGSVMLVFGILLALYERERSGKGQVIDAAIVDGVATLMAVFHSLLAIDPRSLDRGEVRLAGSLPNYRCYRCADDNFIAVGALEPKFHLELLGKLGFPYSLDEFETDTYNLPFVHQDFVR